MSARLCGDGSPLRSYRAGAAADVPLKPAIELDAALLARLHLRPLPGGHIDLRVTLNWISDVRRRLERAQ